MKQLLIIILLCTIFSSSTYANQQHVVLPVIVPPVVAKLSVAVKAYVFTTKAGIAILSVMGSVGFTSFVLEEAEQTCMFGNFALSKPPQYSNKAVRKEFANMSIAAIKHCFKIHDTANYFNNTVGYLYPFGFAYRTYQDANELYLCSQLYKSLKLRDKKAHFNDAGNLGNRCIALYEVKNDNQ